MRSLARTHPMRTSPESILDFAQLWPTEQQTLVERAARVTDGGVIVEIGTAQGGSASLFHAAASQRGVTIYSFDIAPSPEAYDRLRGSGVRIVAKSSIEGAHEWSETARRQIDLLFIDGSHALQHVLEDFNAWAGFLRPGGEVIFHDYDSVERGGMVHLGSYVVLRTILRRGLLRDPVHTDRLLYGTVSHPDRARVPTDECRRTLADLGRDIVHMRDAAYAGWTLIGEAPLARLLAYCLKLDGASSLLSAEKAELPGRFLIFSRPLAPALEALTRRRAGADAMVMVDNLHLCYFVAHALPARRDALLSLAASRNEFFRWEELLFMFEHAFGPSPFPDAIAAGAESDVKRISALVAREQVRLTMLARLLEALLGERP